MDKNKKNKKQEIYRNKCDVISHSSVIGILPAERIRR